MADLVRFRAKAKRTKEWLDESARRLTGADWLPLSVREFFARDVPDLIAEVAELRDFEQAAEADRAAYRREVELVHEAHRRLNGPMLERLRKCAGDTTPNHDGAVTIYPPEARQLLALVDLLAPEVGSDG